MKRKYCEYKVFFTNRIDNFGQFSERLLWSYGDWCWTKRQEFAVQIPMRFFFFFYSISRIKNTTHSPSLTTVMLVDRTIENFIEKFSIITFLFQIYCFLRNERNARNDSFFHASSSFIQVSTDWEKLMGKFSSLWVCEVNENTGMTRII